MKVFVKTLKGTHFEIPVKRKYKVADVKKIIEIEKGSYVYPAAQQILIHRQKVLKDDTTLEENNVDENDFIVVMLKKAQTTSSVPPTFRPAHFNMEPMRRLIPGQFVPPVYLSPGGWLAGNPPAQIQAQQPAPAPAAASGPYANQLFLFPQGPPNAGAGAIDFRRYNQQEPIRHAIPGQIVAPPVYLSPAGWLPGNQSAQTQAQQPAFAPASGPNANPLLLFPQGFPNMGSNAGSGALDFLRNIQQFQALRAMVQKNPQILQPMLQELGKQNPNLMRLIQEHQADFFRLINEPVGGGERNMGGHLASAMPQAMTVTHGDKEAIARLASMGFDDGIVLQVFFECDKNEERAADYLLDHMREFEV